VQCRAVLPVLPAGRSLTRPRPERLPGVSVEFKRGWSLDPDERIRDALLLAACLYHGSLRGEAALPILACWFLSWHPYPHEHSLQLLGPPHCRSQRALSAWQLPSHHIGGVESNKPPGGSERF